MDHVYAFGINVISNLQQVFANEGWYFEMVNDYSVPSYSMDILFPIVATFDSVYAAELCLTVSLCGWLNSVLKWWFLEDRPYWWVLCTNFYKRTKTCRPKIKQTHQSCEGGPGSPSGHSQVAAVTLMTVFLWILSFLNDRNLYVWWWKLVAVPVMLWLLGSVMAARMYCAAHFPHQVVLGALLGLCLAPLITLHVVDPYVFRTGDHARRCLLYNKFWQLVFVFITVFITYFTYLSFEAFGWDLMYTRKMAMKYCKFPACLRKWKPPMFGLVINNGHMFGWVLAVTPKAAEYRHFTRDRSLELAVIAAGLSVFIHNYLKQLNHSDMLWLYYTQTFLIAAVKPLLLLRLVPFVATYPYNCCSRHDSLLKHLSKKNIQRRRLKKRTSRFFR